LDIVAFEYENGRGRRHYLNRSAEFETSVLGVIRVYTPTVHASASEMNTNDGQARRSGLDGPTLVKPFNAEVRAP